MAAYEEMKARLPLVSAEVSRWTETPPVSVGITRKGRSLAFGVSLQTEPRRPIPDRLFGYPIVYRVLSAVTPLYAEA